MADKTVPNRLLSLASGMPGQGRDVRGLPCASTGPLAMPLPLEGTVAPATATVTVKPSAQAPEAPLPGALVRIHQASDGALAWVGASDGAGAYRARGLAPGVAYLAMGIDVEGRYKTVAAGPVLAVALAPALVPVQAVIGQPLAQEIGVLHALEPAGLILPAESAALLPTGVQLDGRALWGDWPTGAPGRYTLPLQLWQPGAEQAQAVSLEVELVLLELTLTASAALPSKLVVGEAVAPVAYAAAGGEGPYVFSTTGALPPGLALTDHGDGRATLAGTPDTAGSYAFGVQVTDVRGDSAAMVFECAVSHIAAYRFWRINVTANNGGASYLVIAEVELRATDGGPDLTLPNGAISASSWANAINAPGFAFDGDAASKWTAAGVVGWLEYDFGAATLVSQVAIMGHHSLGGQEAYAPRDFAIEARNSTGDAWTVIKSITGQTAWGAAEWRVFDL